ncbi:MAG: glycoside hydrolase family 38 C-terminal domain-containing protein, partial [Clostridia bacterium]
RNKRSNRKIELLLREVELWATYAARFGAQYPAQALHSIWQDVLTLQFHDILPGSSIEKVYQDSEAMYAQMFSQLETLKASAMQTLAKQLKGDVLAFNSLSFCRDDILWFDAPESVTALCDAQGSLYPVQRVEGRACAFVRGMASLSVTPYWFSTETVAAESLQVDCHAFQTPFFEGRFDSSMQITSLFDLASQREVARKGEALNQLVVYENKPHNYDAWDINIYYDRRHWPLDDVQSATVVSCGPVLARLRVIRRYMSSTVTQDITLYHSIGRIDFDTQVDWKEQQYLVKAHFPVDVFYNEATYDIQYGNIKRATHKNTSWDTARFEVCAHKWADVSEDDFGVSLLNDCKYGYSADEHSIALTLLKSSTYPNKHADQEEHRFTYSLYPHSGDWRGASTPEMAYRLNIPVQALPGLGVGKAVPFAQVDAPNVIIEAVKQALHGQGSILRMYECYNRRTMVHLTFGFLPNRVELCNLIEETIEELPLVNGELDLLLTPYQIVSLRIS